MYRGLSFVAGCLAFAFCLSLMVDVAEAQPGRGQQGRGQQGGGFGGFGGGNGTELLFDEKVRKELEIVDEQMEKLRDLTTKLREGSRDEMREMFSGFRDLSEEDRRAKFTEIREKMAEKAKEVQSQINEVLLPHQAERLKQLQLQSQMRRSGTTGALGSSQVTEALGITEEQKTKMREVAQEAEKELQEKIAKLREEAKDKILGVLDAGQRSKLESMIGESFEFSSPTSRFGGRGGDQRGGDRGGRTRGGDRNQDSDNE